MPDSTTLQLQYAAQIQADLEGTTAEREYVAAQITELQAQLAVLENNYVLLTLVQQALGSVARPSTEIPAETVEASVASSIPRPRGNSSAHRPVRAKAGRSNPTLRELVAAHLAQTNDPLSAAEVTATLSGAHPDRNIANTVVRNALENLVAKGQAQRTRKNRSVRYTAQNPLAPLGTTSEGEDKADAITPRTTCQSTVIPHTGSATKTCA
ncbi:potassium-transporting ATPase subunit C [Streptomyces violascens]|uniref:hypothetical protein n=1 Tax=Streptomyces violascens TaxID=67381 RepID=UPI00367CC113